MTDFELAMTVLAAIGLVFGVALAAQRRRPLDGHAKERIDTIGDDVAELKAEQAMIAKRQAETDHNVAQIRTMFAALPSKDALHKVQLNVAELSGKVETSSEVGLATRRAVERIENILMSRST